MLDEKLGYVFSFDGFDVGIGRYFPQCAGEGERILGHLGSSAVGQVFPFALDGETHQHGEEITDGCKNND